MYCRQPDSSAPNLNYGADHYRPKSRFQSLVCAYDNLYYCCGDCNSRKTDYWPLDEKAGPYIVNPCEYEMAAHLWFDATTGRIEPKTSHGRHTEDLLQLNDPASVQFRKSALLTVRLFREEIVRQGKVLVELEKLFQRGGISVAERDAEIVLINEDLLALNRTLQSHSGELPLLPLRKQRFGVKLTAP